MCIAFTEQESQGKADLQNSNRKAKSYLKGTLQLIISSWEGACIFSALWADVTTSVHKRKLHTLCLSYAKQRCQLIWARAALGFFLLLLSHGKKKKKSI